MDTTGVKKVVFSTVTSSERLDDGTWKAITVTTERHEMDDGTVKEEKVDAMCIDDDIARAVSTSSRSALSFILENVYKNGFEGLIDYHEFQRSKEENKEQKVD